MTLLWCFKSDKNKISPQMNLEWMPLLGWADMQQMPRVCSLRKSEIRYSYLLVVSFRNSPHIKHASRHSQVFILCWIENCHSYWCLLWIFSFQVYVPLCLPTEDKFLAHLDIFEMMSWRGLSKCTFSLCLISVVVKLVLAFFWGQCQHEFNYICLCFSNCDMSEYLMWK